MAGRGSRFKKEGYDFPKPLIQIYGKPFFYWAARSVCKFAELASLDFVVLQEHIDRYGIDREILKYFPDASIHALPDVTEGAVITCMKGVEHIEDDFPVIFNDCDHLFVSSALNSFLREGFDPHTDGVLLTFPSDEPKFSFVGKDDQGRVVRTAEKEVISREAICGCYYFSSKARFLAAAEQYLHSCSYSEYFMSGVYNVLLGEGAKVRSLPTDFHVTFGVPEEYELARDDSRYEALL